ncbi:hypothetical protein B0A49_05890 [Cryomyces minteri]|uniref:SnoaL-like domain-containing protein n=1 Tax=Cryomyces minteri TaxID=331657 RepID=A0A4U0WCP0_9PEZI|nr:hypothetical protein B0A49_05890 [Cryomyces minteri]
MPLAHHEEPITRSALLRKSAHAFCTAFLDLPSNPPAKLLSTHFTPTSPKITEHGPSWASSRLPFLGKTFTGRADCEAYFALLAQTLEFHPSADTFPPPSGLIVDADAVMEGTEERTLNRGQGAGMVSVVGRARFKAVKTGREWREVFVYRLSEFDEEGRIGHWEIWADPLSAWEAVGGE